MSQIYQKKKMTFSANCGTIRSKPCLLTESDVNKWLNSFESCLISWETQFQNVIATIYLYGYTSHVMFSQWVILKLNDKASGLECLTSYSGLFSRLRELWNEKSSSAKLWWSGPTAIERGRTSALRSFTFAKLVRRASSASIRVLLTCWCNRYHCSEAM